MNPHQDAGGARIVALLVAVLVVAATGVVIARQHSGDTVATATTVAITKVVKVERGDLTVSESVDGTLEETDTISVVHRIEGQQSSTTPGSSAAVATPAVSPAGSATSSPVSAPASASPATQSFTVPAARTEVATTTPTTTPTGPPSSPPGSPPGTVPGSPPGTVPGSTPGSTPGSVPDSSVPTGSTVPTSTSTPTSGPSSSVPSGGGGPAGSGSGRGATVTGGAAATSPASSQMITGVAGTGDAIASGDILYTVESTPVVALVGALPAWRTISRTSPDGADIAQLESALVALGYDPDDTVTVDQHWTSATTAMVKRWQAGLGTTATGSVTLGDVVFIPHASTVAAAAVSVGDSVQDGTKVLELAGTVQQVVIEVPTALQAVVSAGLVVDVAGGSAKVVRLRSAEGSSGVVVQALISPDAPVDSPAGSTVKVKVSHALATGQLLVATEAVVSLIGGGYALEVPTSDGSHSFVPVEVVAVSGNRTAITGDGVSESMTVLAPA